MNLGIALECKSLKLRLLLLIHIKACFYHGVNSLLSRKLRIKVGGIRGVASVRTAHMIKQPIIIA